MSATASEPESAPLKTLPSALRSISYHGLEPGPALIVLGAVHGNETCGTQAILRLAAAFEREEFTLARGTLTLVPITNPLAYRLQQRQGDRNLNRNLRISSNPQDFEDRVANRLCPLLAAHDVLLDLHSFHTPGDPFVMLGPSNNSGGLEPFAQAAEEEALARRLGPRRIVEGWLETYAIGVAQRLRNPNASLRAQMLSTDPTYGIGTTEYMRSQGGYGVTLECGQHNDPQAPEVAYQAILNTLIHLQLLTLAPPKDPFTPSYLDLDQSHPHPDRSAPHPDRSPPRSDRSPSHPGPLPQMGERGLNAAHPPKTFEPRTNLEVLRLVEVVDRDDTGDQFIRPWQSFDRIKAGETIGKRADGREVLAPTDGFIVFPNPNAAPGNEWFYRAEISSRAIDGVLSHPHSHSHPQ